MIIVEYLHPKPSMDDVKLHEQMDELSKSYTTEYYKQLMRVITIVLKTDNPKYEDIKRFSIRDNGNEKTILFDSTPVAIQKIQIEWENDDFANSEFSVALITTMIHSYPNGGLPTPQSEDNN